MATNVQKSIPEATIICGDSRYIFEASINTYVNEPTTFFLDAHHQKEGQPFVTTALHELLAISKHPLLNYFTILIDDIRLFRSSYWGVNFDTLIKFVNNVKPNVKIDYIDNRLFKDDIMVLT